MWGIILSLIAFGISIYSLIINTKARKALKNLRKDL